MTTAKKRFSHSETRKEEHLRFLEQLESLPLTDSCCEICHCDCYSSHRSSELNELSHRDGDDVLDFYKSNACKIDITKPDSNNNNHTTSKKSEEVQTTTASVLKAPKVKLKKKKSASSSKINSTQSHESLHTKSAKTSPTTSKSPVSTLNCGVPTITNKKRSKSATSMHSQESRASIHATNMRDCKILQELLTSLEDTPRLEIHGKNRKSLGLYKNPPPGNSTKSSWPSSLDKSSNAAALDSKSTLAPIKLCESMANLCLSPMVRQAFGKVPMHDKKILNRMAIKRSEGVAAKENAWLARKYWENERYERELLKCEEMEEYKRAVRDKQFQDYLVTKARINEIAQRDLAELQRLRESLQYKDERAKRRIETMRMERDIMQCQRRCDELRKSESVNIQQEEQNLDAAIRKQEICQRLTERLQRAEHIRSQMLESYLKRVRYDNYIEQLLHEEKWREAQKMELLRREQLKEHISRKRKKSQRFVDSRMRRNEAITKTAKISASLRELVRNSVTPDGGGGGAAAAGGNFSGAVPLSLGRLLFERPISKLSIK